MSKNLENKPMDVQASYFFGRYTHGGRLIRNVRVMPDMIQELRELPAMKAAYFAAYMLAYLQDEDEKDVLLENIELAVI